MEFELIFPCNIYLFIYLFIYLYIEKWNISVNMDVTVTSDFSSPMWAGEP